MQKQFIPAALALILVLSAGSSYAPVNPPGNGGCPPAFEAKELPFFIPADANRDFITCWIVTRRNTIITDNRFPL